MSLNDSFCAYHSFFPVVAAYTQGLPCSGSVYVGFVKQWQRTWRVCLVVAASTQVFLGSGSVHVEFAQQWQRTRRVCPVVAAYTQGFPDSSSVHVEFARQWQRTDNVYPLVATYTQGYPLMAAYKKKIVLLHNNGMRDRLIITGKHCGNRLNCTKIIIYSLLYPGFSKQLA